MFIANQSPLQACTVFGVQITTANFNVADGLTMTVGDGSAGYDSIASSNTSAIINKIGEGDLTINSSMQYFTGTLNLNEGTLNMKNVFGGSLVIADNTILNTYITAMNAGSNIYTGTISGVDVLDVYFDNSVNLNDVLGTTTTIFDSSINSSLSITLDAGDITGAYVEDNKVIVSNEITIASDAISATVSKNVDSAETSISITAGTFEIAEGSTQTFDNISTTDGSYLELSGGTLSTTSNITLANDDSSTGIKATSGVIESTATVNLSEGTTTVSSDSSLEIIAQVSVSENTTSSLGGTDSSVILQDTISLGESSSLELVGNISGSAGIVGVSKETSAVKYSGTYSVGNSPALVTHSNTTMDLTETTLQMEIFGTNGVAGEDFDKIIYENVDLSFGNVEIILENIDSWADWSNIAGETYTFEFDLFDYIGETNVNIDELSLDFIYDSENWSIDTEYSELFADTDDSLGFANDGILSITITSTVPEPSTYAMIFGLLAFGFAYYRKRK